MTPNAPESASTDRSRRLQCCIHDWLIGRHEAEVKKLAPTDPKQKKFAIKYEPSFWINNAAHRAVQIQSVTHALKHTHPDARGTSLHVRPDELPAIDAVGSHVLAAKLVSDIDGSAAALDVAAFLGQCFEGRTLLELATARDPDFLAALSDEPGQAERLAHAFAAVAAPRGRPSGHTLGKQVFWRVGNDPCDDAAFEQLLVLTPTSLVHRLHTATQADRFGDDAKVAHKARRAGLHDERPVRRYTDLAVQRLGGSNAQNLSQLNKRRGGRNPLLASLPPVWRSAEVRPILGPTTLFAVISARDEVEQVLRELVAYLGADPDRVQETRRERAALVDRLIDEFVAFSQQYGALDPGWTLDPACRLPAHERRWLDPGAHRVAEAAAAAANKGRATDRPAAPAADEPPDDELPVLDFSAMSASPDDDDDDGASDGDDGDTDAPPGPIHPVVREMAAALAAWINERLYRKVGLVGEAEAHRWRQRALGPLRDSWEDRA